ncbi:MAG: YcfA-like protein [Arenicellales bacterium IbO2]|nr:MAG: YcfA-like protein [Arenicellales bacterium IbO2]
MQADLAVPRKIRHLIGDLLAAGCFLCKGGKGSHRKWKHPSVANKLTLSGRDGADAKPYQESDVEKYLEEIQSAKSGK